MSDTTQEAPKEFKIEITISPQNISYKSDFDELATVSWLEFTKSTILDSLKKTTIQES